MAELDYLMPLRVQRPVFDYGGALSEAQDIRSKALAEQGQRTNNALAALRLDEETGQANALKSYRTAAAAGDPSAPDKLAGYPEMQSQVYDALDKMADRDRQAAVRRGLRIAEAAKAVSMLPDGPGKTDAWNRQLDALRKNGDISEEQYRQFFGTPSDLVIDQALALGQTVEQFIADRAARRPKSYSDLPIAEKLKIDSEIDKRASAGLPTWMSTGIDPGEMATRRAKARREVLSDYGLTGDPFDGRPATAAAGPVKTLKTLKAPDASQPAGAPSPDNVAQPTSQEEFDALPSGSYFINPATGAVMRKR